MVSPLSTSQELKLLSVGEQFKAARTTQRLSLRDISDVTKIQPWVLETLERDELHKTMSPIYVKGFVTTYAKCLHLDPRSLIQQLYPPPTPSEPATVPSPRPTGSSAFEGGVELPWALIRRLGTVAVGVIALVVMVKANPLRRFSVETPRQEASLTIASEQPTVRPETLVIPLNQSLELKLIARRSTWISVEGDGRLLTQRELAAGAQETWKAKRQLKLIVAKPFHVDVILNGQSISPLVLAHQGRVLIHHRTISALPNSPEAPDLKVRAGVSSE